MKTLARRDGMKRPAKGLCLIGLGFFVTFFGGRFDQSARAADGQLLVVVEAPPALEADAAEIRRAIGAELHARTIAPMSTPAEAPGRALIVALDRDRIAMSLRASDGTSVVRVIPAPVERGARLRAIAWLAGNLARDQVSPILAEGPAEASPSAMIPAPPATPVATAPPPAATEPPAEQPPSSLLPPPSSPPPPSDVAAATISVRPEPQKSPGPLLWSVSGSVGPVIAAFERDPSSAGPFSVRIHDSTAWQLEVQRRRINEHLVIGGTFEGTRSNRAEGDSPQLLGVNVFMGAAWHYRHCNLEATIGAGPEAASILQFDILPTGGQTEPSPYYSYRFELYAKGTVAAAVPLGDSIEGLLELGFHVSGTHEESWFGASTIGLRYVLP
jgi:hypothetical protein